MLTSTALVLLMTIPGLALFYGGLVGKKNIVSTISQSFMITCVVTLVWFICGYSLTFGEGNLFIGDFSKTFLKGVEVAGLTLTIPETVFVCYQLTFAIITVALIWLYLVPIILLMIVFGFGLATISARLTVHIQDLNKLNPFLTRVVFYVSGIFFSIETVLKDYPLAMQIASWNPVYVYISLARGAMVEGYSMTAGMWIAAVAWALGLFVIGTIFFWRAEERYGREI